MRRRPSDLDYWSHKRFLPVIQCVRKPSGPIYPSHHVKDKDGRQEARQHKQHDVHGEDVGLQAGQLGHIEVAHLEQTVVQVI